eukprot:1161706-Pelagomonas_calceolata.AAC.4
MARKQEEARQRGVPMDSTWDGRIVGKGLPCSKVGKAIPLPSNCSTVAEDAWRERMLPHALRRLSFACFRCGLQQLGKMQTHVLVKFSLSEMCRACIAALPMNRPCSFTYQVLSLLLEEKSREKIVFISKSDASSRMIEDFDVDALAPAFGGTFKPRRIDETWCVLERTIFTYAWHSDT